MAEKHHSTPPQHPGHETTDVRMKPIIWLTLILTAASIFAFVSMVYTFNLLEQREAAVEKQPSPLAEPDALPPEPRLQQVPQLDLEQYQQRSQELLERYQWIDKDGQVLRIPVDRAIDLLLERGIPPVEAAPPGQEQP